MAWSRSVNWNEYNTIPDTLKEQYLHRLNINERPVSLEFLNEIVYKTQCTIPYETLDVTDLQKAVLIHPEALMKKILMNHRGGYCFEINGLLYLFLIALGFDARLCHCRSLRDQSSPLFPATHCGIFIYLDGKKYFCDCGFAGPGPRAAIEFIDNLPQNVYGETFTITRSDILYTDHRHTESGWYTLSRNNKPLIQVAGLDISLMDLYGVNMLRSIGDSAYDERTVSIKTENGYVSLHQNTLTIKKGEQVTKHEITEAELAEVLLTYFQITI